MEVWKDIIGYESLYQISNKGNVKSKERVIIYNNGKSVFYKSKERKPSISEYRKIALSKNNSVKLFKISRLVAIHFLPKNLNRNVVNHKDYNKFNDDVENLEWVSNSENIIHSNKRNNKLIGIFFDKKEINGAVMFTD